MTPWEPSVSYVGQKMRVGRRVVTYGPMREDPVLLVALCKEPGCCMMGSARAVSPGHQYPH